MHRPFRPRFAPIVIAMPTYVYRRERDGSTFEVEQSIHDEPLSEDPETGEPVRKVLLPPAIHFKGSGFYNTDYKNRKSPGEQNGNKRNSSTTKNDSVGKDSKQADG